MSKRILIPLPNSGFDPTEAAIPWKILHDNGMDVVFATPEGKKGTADDRMLRGTGLGIWKLLLQAREDAVEAYTAMEKSAAFNAPLRYSDLKEASFDALLLPGGHDKGVKVYLESSILQTLVVDFFKSKKPVGAICHGVVLLARSIDPDTKKSVLWDYQTTSLLQSQELTAFNLTRLYLGEYYLTYPGLSVESEVRSALSDKNNFRSGPTPLFRDDPRHLNRGFTVRDRNFLSARWPGDAYNFALEFLKMLIN